MMKKQKDVAQGIVSGVSKQSIIFSGRKNIIFCKCFSGKVAKRLNIFFLNFYFNRILNELKTINTCLSQKIFSQDKNQLEYYKHRLIDLSPKLLTSNKSAYKRERIFENFENENYNLLLCSSRGMLLLGLNSKRPSKPIFLDIPIKKAYLSLDYRGITHIDDEVFFIIPSAEDQRLLKLVSKFDIKLNLL